METSINTLKKERVQWVDTARGIGIILVILGHMSGLGVINMQIYSFHLPLFFFLSGYITKNDVSPLRFLIKKVKSLIIPYLFLSAGIILFLTLSSIYRKTFSFSFLGSTILTYIVQRRTGTIWFLSCLFLLEIIFYFLSKYLKEYLLFIACVIMSALGIVYVYIIHGPALPWNIDACFMALPFYYIGYILKKHSGLLNRFFCHKVLSFLLFIGFLICNIGFAYLNYRITKRRIGMYEMVYGIYPLMLIAAVSGIFATIIIATKIKSNIMTHIGANSLIYFGWHQQIFLPISVAIMSRIDLYLLFGNTWYSAIAFILILSLCAITENIITRTKLRVLIGKF